MTRRNDQETIADEDLDDVQGGGLLDAEPGTFGVRKPRPRTGADDTTATAFATTASGSPNI